MAENRNNAGGVKSEVLENISLETISSDLMRAMVDNAKISMDEETDKRHLEQKKLVDVLLSTGLFQGECSNKEIEPMGVIDEVMTKLMTVRTRMELRKIQRNAEIFTLDAGVVWRTLCNLSDFINSNVTNEIFKGRIKL